MNIEEFREYCLSKKGASEKLPFGPDTLVFNVMDKAFALTSINEVPFRANLKCDPERAIELRASHEEIQPGYHMNKKHWNTVFMEDSLSDNLILELVDHSYDLVVKGLSKVKKEELESLKE